MAVSAHTAAKQWPSELMVRGSPAWAGGRQNSTTNEAGEEGRGLSGFGNPKTLEGSNLC
jgi:hypothetical protein